MVFSQIWKRLRNNISLFDIIVKLTRGELLTLNFVLLNHILKLIIHCKLLRERGPLLPRSLLLETCPIGFASNCGGCCSNRGFNSCLCIGLKCEIRSCSRLRCCHKLTFTHMTLTCYRLMSHERALLRQKFVGVLSNLLDSGAHKFTSLSHWWHFHSGQLLFFIDLILLNL